MPLTRMHGELLSRIGANRSPDSYVAGATVLHRDADTPRFSDDLDLFHDVEDSVAQSAEADAATLQAAGYPFSWLLRTPTFHRALVTLDGEQLKIEWAHAGRHVAHTQEDLDRLSLREPLDLRDLKQRWIAAVDGARAIVAMLPPEEAGCLYLGADRMPLTPDATSPQFDRLTRHKGRVRGAWPTLSPYRASGEE